MRVETIFFSDDIPPFRCRSAQPRCFDTALSGGAVARGSWRLHLDATHHAWLAALGHDTPRATEGCFFGMRNVLKKRLVLGFFLGFISILNKDCWNILWTALRSCRHNMSGHLKNCNVHSGTWVWSIFCVGLWGFLYIQPWRFQWGAPQKLELWLSGVIATVANISGGWSKILGTITVYQDISGIYIYICI